MNRDTRLSDVLHVLLHMEQANELLTSDVLAKGPDNKMSAYRFDARPCRIIGNMGCPKQARLRLFRLGEPLRDTLLRSFAPR